MKKRILAYLLSATLVVGLVPATAWAEELPQQPDGAVVEEQQNDAEGGAVAPEVNPEETPETAPEDVPVVPEGDANGEGSNDSTVDETEGTTEDADSEGANGEDGAVPEEDKVAPEEKPEQVPMMTLAEAEPVATDDVAMIGEDSYKTLAAAIAAVPEDGTETTITLTQKEVTIDSKIGGTDNKNIIIDLAGNKLDVTIINDNLLYLKNNASVTFRNGTILANNYVKSNQAVIFIETGSSVTLDKVMFETNASALFPCGNAAAVNVVDSTIKGGAYAVATNAASDNNHNVQIKLKNSSFEALSAVFVNIPCTLEMQNCDVVGEMHGVVVRGGTATITGGTIAMNYKDDDAEEMAHYFDNKDWLDGNTVNLAALTMGNKHKISYQYATNVTLDGVTLSSEGKYADLFPAVYAWANADADKGVTFDQKNCTFNGAVIFGNGGNNISAPVVEMNGKKYSTLEQAVKEAKGGETITLLQDVTLTETIKTDKNLTINLNDKTITGNDVRAFQVVNGTLTLTGKGTVTSKKIDKLKDSSSVILVGNNGNAGKPSLIIEEDVTIDAPATYGVTVFGSQTTETVTVKGKIHATPAAAISGNGSKGYGGTTIIIENTAELISDDDTAIYHPQSGTLKINGGKITGAGGIEAKAGETTVAITGNPVIKATASVDQSENNNGTSTRGYAIAAVNNQNYAGGAKITIASGYYTGPIAVLTDNEVVEGKKATIEISGGYFTSDPGAYVVEGKASLESDKAGYTYMVGDKPADVIPEKPATAPPDVDVSGIPKDQQEDVEKTAESTNADSVLTEAARTTKLDEGTKQTAVQEAVTELGADADDVTVYKQTYLYVKATNAVVESAEITKLTLDITPMMQVVASTAKSADAIELGEKGKNAVTVGEAKELTINTPSVITVTLPDDFKVDNQTVYIKHEAQSGTYFYTATAVTETDGTKTVTFTSKHGFSPFTFMTTNEAVAEIDGVGYETLQEAINHVKDGETIKLLKESEENIYVRNRISFTLDGTDKLTGSINAGSRYRMRTKVEGDQTTYTFTKKSSGSSGSSSSSQEYKVTIADGIENGKVKVDPTKAEKGDKVTITVTPNKGYEINKVYAKDADGDKLELKDKGDGEYTFTMPDSKVEVKATFVKAEEEKPAEPEEIPAAEKIVLTVNERAAMVFGNVVVNDVAPIIRNDRTMLPIRFVAKNLGAEVTWDAQFQKVSITKDDLKIEIIIGSPVAFVNGENVTLDSPAFIENSRTYLPLRFVAENLGATVLWDAKAQEVTIVPEKAAETK